MKKVRSALALAITLSLVLLSPGGSAWAQVAEAVGHGTVSPVSGIPAGAINSLPANVAPLGLTTLNLPAMSASFAAPSAAVPSAAVSAAAAAAAPVSVAPAKLSAAMVAPAPAAAVSTAKDESGPAATALEGVRRELPNFSKMGTGASKDAASSDFLSRVGELFHHSAPALSAVPAASNGMTRSFLSKAGAKREMPAEDVDGAGNPQHRDEGLDGLGNPVRSAGENGPDDHASDEGRGAGSSGLFALLGVAGLAAVHGSLLQPLLTLPLVMLSLILHEIGHAQAAARLGDPTATLEGRASFNPRTWAKHVDPFMTIGLPMITYFTSGFIFGGAKAVPVNQGYFKNPAQDMAKVALAGPAVNIALAGLGALAYAGAAAGGFGAVVLGALTGFVFINAVLAIFNLIPLPPLDGGHILTALLPRSVGDRVQDFYARIGMLGMVPVMLIALAGGGVIMAAAAGLTHLLIGISFAATGVQMASAALPAVAALGMAIGSLRHPAGVARLTAQAAPTGPAVPSAAAGASSQPVDLVVVFSDRKSLTKDLHLTSADSRAANYVQTYEGVQRSLLAQMDSVGLTTDVLSAYNATPIASYRRINAATIRLDAAKVSEFEAALRAQGHKVYPNRRIVIPAPIVAPESTDPDMRNAVSMADNLKITKADAVQALALKRWGKPEMSPWRKFTAALGFDAPPQPNFGVVDSGADLTHPLLGRVKDVKNATSGANVDDIGHGSWVTSMVLNYAPWARNVTHYKTFLNGSATTDDILKALTMSANDGNLVISNSWGDDEGDPEGPDSLLVKKLASEGHIMVFAAGNAGPGKNTVGAPAIVQYKDAATGAIRVVAVAATDRNKKVAYFSSRGPGSPKTQGKDGFAHRPDLAAIGYNTEGAWPANLGDADRTDPEAGTLKAISGTSMSTPSVAGAIALLAMVFGVTQVGEKLDAIVNGVMATLEKTGKNGPDDEGEGFINVTAAYEHVYKQFNPRAIPPTAVARYRSFPSDAKITAALEAEYPGIQYHAAGIVARAWTRLTGRAPVPAHIAEYRRLSAKLEDDEARRRSYMRSLPNATGVREEMLELYENTIEPEFAADAAAYAALLRAYPNVEYESAGAVARFFLRLSGRGPKA